MLVDFSGFLSRLTRLFHAPNIAAPSAAAMPIPPEVIAQLHPDDHFVVSYPRSGNTWMRHLIQELILLRNPGAPRPASLDDLQPTVHRGVFREPDLATYGLSHRILKSHNIRDLLPYQMVYLFRQPADAIVSLFHNRINRARAKGLEMPRFTLSEFARHAAPEWCEHLGIALDHAERQPERIAIVSYERLLTEPLPAFRSIARFLGLDSPDDQLSAAIKACEFDRLKKREQERKPLVAEKQFFRRGREGGGKDELDPALLKSIEEMSSQIYQRAANAMTETLAKKLKAHPDVRPSELHYSI